MKILCCKTGAAKDGDFNCYYYKQENDFFIEIYVDLIAKMISSSGCWKSNDKIKVVLLLPVDIT